MVSVMPHPSHTEREHHHHAETAKASRAPSPKFIAVIAAAAIIAVSFSVIAIHGGNPNFEYDCDADGNITVRNTSSGLLTGASWDVFNYFTNDVTTYAGDAAEWNDPGDEAGPHVYSVTLIMKTYAGVERSVTKDVVRDGFREYTVEWTSNEKSYSILVSINTSDFIYYKDTNINRAPGSAVNTALVERYVFGTTTSNNAFEYIVDQFNEQFDAYGLTDDTHREERVNNIMEFVQEIGYATDLATTGYSEYWKFPIETLFAQGDCEDLSMLTMALFLAIEDLPVALFVFWNINGTGEGHAMAAIDLELIPHTHTDPQDVSEGWYTTNGRTYCSCETTALGWTVGEIAPLLYDVKPDRLIEVLPPS